MKMLPRIGFTLVLIIAALSLCAAGRQRGITVRLTHADSGSTIELHPDDKLEIVLPGNPTTGYTWEVRPGAEALLKQKGDPEFAPDSKALGAGGRTTIRFDVIAAGKASLVLIYHRTFEQTVPPLRNFGIRVVVTDEQSKK